VKCPKEKRRPAASRTPKNYEKFARADYSKVLASASLGYAGLIVDWYAQGLLAPFRCAVCGALAVDPCGRNNKGGWLCRRFS
jgi:hypothetical protein